jgi:filamentous hemagglutinin family protein
MRIRQLLALTLAAAHALGIGTAWANPIGGSVVTGQATFDNRGNLLTVVNTPGTVINWQGFSIGANEITRFVQQDGSSAVLNRIVGQDPSLILGALQSNGHVFLVNPNGIVFGKDARVDVNGLVASSLDIANDDFRAGRLHFSAAAASPGDVRNQGAITTPSGGRVYLVAPNVENSGLIASPQGEVVLAAGREVQLVDSRNPDLHVVVSAPQDRALNLGRIVSQAGSIGIYGTLVEQRGVVDADSAVVGANGRIVFRASDTALLEAGSETSARGAGTGGSVHVLGDHVGITGDAAIDASGHAGGGTVLVGGDYRGANPAIANASATYVGPQTSIRADAIDSGDGGRVVVWSNDATRAYGSISARGGATSGDGGFAEVSGHYLDFGARADLRAAHGTAGNLLLDPNDITIQATGPTTVVSSPPNFGGGPASSILTVADLEAQLALGSVTVTTLGGSGGPLGGRITVANAVSWNSGMTLTLDADNGIAINGPISSGGDSRLELLSRGGGITQTAPIFMTYLVVDSAGDANLAGSINGVSVIAARVGDGHSFRFHNAGPLLVSSLGGVNGIFAPDGNISLYVAGDLTQIAGAPLLASTANIQANNVILTEPNSVNTLSGALIGGNASNTFSFAAGGGLTIGGGGIQAGNGDVTLSTGDGPLALNSGVVTGGGAVSLSAGASAITGSVTGLVVSATAFNGISLDTHTQSFSATNNGGNGIVVNNTGALTLGNVTDNGAGPISIAATGPLTVSGAVTQSFGGAITLSAGPTGNTTDNLAVNGGIATAPGTGIAVSTTGPILLRAGNAISVSGAISGNVTQQANLNPPPVDPCVADPTLTGCTPPPPTLDACIATPSLAGCSAVLPSLAACTVTPSTAGCQVVLPTLASCTATPSLAGCTAVLPTLGQCIATPTLPGCAAQLPTLAECTALPTIAGCQVVLPTLASCIAAPTQSGCEAVLPTLAQCTASPSLPGCSAVLPPAVACAADPSGGGCTSQSAPGNPVVQDINHLVNLVNNSVSQVTSDPSGSPDSSQKKPDTTPQGSSQNSGAKANDSSHKMYCN